MAAPFHRRRLARRPGRLSPQRQALAEWRRIDLTSVEQTMAPTSRRAADILPRVLEHLRMDRRQAEAEIVKVWNHLIDPNITRHAQPTGLRDGTLFVTVDSNVWLAEIVRYRRREILERLHHSFGQALIQRISFRVG